MWNITDKKTLKKKCYAKENLKKIEEKADWNIQNIANSNPNTSMDKV